MNSATCKTCGLPVELCVCHNNEAHITQQINNIYVEERKYGKEVTVIEIKTSPQIVDVDNLLETLKSKFACGGSVESRSGLRPNDSENVHKQIELQGNHKSGVREYLLTSPQSCHSCNAVLSEYGNIEFCPECGSKLNSEDGSGNTNVYTG